MELSCNMQLAKLKKMCLVQKRVAFFLKQGEKSNKKAG
jgi:hypothetical protein